LARLLSQDSPILKVNRHPSTQPCRKDRKQRFDLILFSWAMPLIDVKRVVGSLKPGGFVVVDCAVDYVSRNGILKKFDDLRIERGVAD
jgi:hypothetical protein